MEIKPISAEFPGNCGVLLSRTQFPLQVCYATALHKVHDATLRAYHAIIGGAVVFTPQQTSFLLLTRNKLFSQAKKHAISPVI